MQQGKTHELNDHLAIKRVLEKDQPPRREIIYYLTLKMQVVINYSRAKCT